MMPLATRFDLRESPAKIVEEVFRLFQKRLIPDLTIQVVEASLVHSVHSERFPWLPLFYERGPVLVDHTENDESSHMEHLLVLDPNGLLEMNACACSSDLGCVLYPYNLWSYVFSALRSMLTEESRVTDLVKESALEVIQAFSSRASTDIRRRLSHTNEDRSMALDRNIVSGLALERLMRKDSDGAEQAVQEIEEILSLTDAQWQSNREGWARRFLSFYIRLDEAILISDAQISEMEIT